MFSLNNVSTKAFTFKLNLKTKPASLDARLDNNSTTTPLTNSSSSVTDVTNIIWDSKLMPFKTGNKRHFFLSLYNRSILTQTKNSSTNDSKDIISSLGPGLNLGFFSASVSLGRDIKTFANATDGSRYDKSNNFVRLSTSFEKEVPQMFLIKKSFKIKADIAYYSAPSSYNLNQLNINFNKKIDDFVEFNIFYNLEKLDSKQKERSSTTRRRLSFNVLFNIM